MAILIGTRPGFSSQIKFPVFCKSYKGGSYGNKILYKNLKFFNKIEDFVTLLMGKKSC